MSLPDSSNPFVGLRPFESNESLLFFTVGCYLAFEKSQPLLNQSISTYSPYFLITWLLIVSVTTYLMTFNHGGFVLNFLNNTGILVGIMAVWSLYDLIEPAHIMKYSTLFAYTFIIYAVHEPLLTILVKGMFYWFGKTDASSLLIYLTAPLLVIALCMFLRYVWIRTAPGFYDFATGGR